MDGTVQYLIYLGVLVGLGIPLGAYIKKVMYGEKTFLSPICGLVSGDFVNYLKSM